MVEFMQNLNGTLENVVKYIIPIVLLWLSVTAIGGGFKKMAQKIDQAQDAFVAFATSVEEILVKFFMMLNSLTAKIAFPLITIAYIALLVFFYMSK